MCVVLVLVGGSVTLAGVAAAARPSRPRTAPARPFSYCATQNAVFKDPHPSVGVSDPFVQIGTTQFQNCSFGLMAADHIGAFRGGISWAGTEWYPGMYNFAPYDALVTKLAWHHMRFLPGFLETPRWLSTQPPGGPQLSYPPRDPAQFAAFVSMCVRRYGRGGTFWRANPRVPYYPVFAWQIWNEPNLATYWEPAPNAGAYVALLRAAYTAIKQIDPHAIVVTAGMPFTSAGNEASWLYQLYRAGVRGTFDALALHPYAVTVTGALARIQTARRVMNRFGDRRKPIWLTEWGWAGGPPNPYIVNPAGQRANAAGFLKLVQNYRTRLGIGEVVYYDWHDMVYGPGPTNWWGYHLGLFTQSLRPKPALAAFVAAARRLDR
jgi:hypothetical protein